MESGCNALSSLGWRKQSSRIGADVSPFRRHPHKLLNGSVHLEMHMLESVLIVLTDRIGADNRRLEERQQHAIVSVIVHYRADVAAIQRDEISGDSGLDRSGLQGGRSFDGI